LAGVATDRGAMHLGLTGPTPSLRRSGITRMCFDYEQLQATDDRALARYESVET
jgi:hypothetical protein